MNNKEATIDEVCEGVRLLDRLIKNLESEEPLDDDHQLAVKAILDEWYPSFCEASSYDDILTRSVHQLVFLIRHKVMAQKMLQDMDR